MSLHCNRDPAAGGRGGSCAPRWRWCRGCPRGPGEKGAAPASPCPGLPSTCKRPEAGLSPARGGYNTPGRGGGQGEPAQPHPRPRPRPPRALTFARPPPGRSPSPVQGRAAPLLRGQTPSGEAVRAGDGGALLPGGPRRPAVTTGLGLGASALGAGHGCGAGGGGGVRWRRGGDRWQRRRRCPSNRSSARGLPATPLAGPPRRWPSRGQWAAPRAPPRGTTRGRGRSPAIPRAGQHRPRSLLALLNLRPHFN